VRGRRLRRRPGPALPCDDGNPCTDDSCAPASGCAYAPNSLPCDDQNACTITDCCVDGGCVGVGSLDCDDDNPCTKDSCEPASGCAWDAQAGPCSDGDLCTVGDACAGGVCVAGPAADCDDGIGCTVDSCIPASGCQNVPLDAYCVDQNDCTQDSCDPVLGCQNLAEGICPGTPVINEIDYDQPSTDTMEFVEITTKSGAVDLSKYKLELINGANGELYGTVALDAGLASNKLDAGGHLVIGSQAVLATLSPDVPAIPFAASTNNIQNGGPDGMRIVTKIGGAAADGVAYEGTMPGIGEGGPGPYDSSSSEASIGRCPDGHDSDDNALDFDVLTPTPGAPNDCG